MTDSIPLDAVRAPPDRDTVLRTQGTPVGHEVPERVECLVERAVDLYATLTNPRGVLAELSLSDFQRVYHGEGQNEVPNPLSAIAPGANRLALFAVTLGDTLSQEIKDLFAANDPALASMLDGIASERADTAATLLGRHFLDTLIRSEQVDPDTRVLGYSPGYCGWNVTGQRELFAFLRPERIGITLNSSCLMHPLKSVSGVLVAGAGEIHQFESDFDFCDSCSTHECRIRIASVS